MRMQSRRSHAAESDTMRKIVVLAAIAALIAAAVGIWSTATFDRPKVAGDVQATEVRGAPVSPHEIMVKQGRVLPVEYWADPFSVKRRNRTPRFRVRAWRGMRATG